jgi:hypothetical protein
VNECRFTRHSSLECGVLDVVKRVAAWCIVVVYALMACGSMLEAGCCQNDAAHSEAEHDMHRHVHSKIKLAIHAVSHCGGSEDGAFLASRHCCCLSQAEQEPGLQPHAFARKVSSPEISDSLGKTITPEGPCTGPHNARGGSPYLLDDLQSKFILRSIHATVLLI